MCVWMYVLIYSNKKNFEKYLKPKKEKLGE